MAATGILYEAVNATKAALTALNLVPVTDPRNARPLTVMVELPTMDAFTYNVGDFRLRVRILAGPPGNQDAADYLLTTADTIMNSPIAVVDAQPGFATYGGQELPTYDLTVAVAVRRN
jgi:ABC-type Zn uptake system ZnuABC Zn-binding protein ZnuA